MSLPGYGSILVSENEPTKIDEAFGLPLVTDTMWYRRQLTRVRLRGFVINTYETTVFQSRYQYKTGIF